MRNRSFAQKLILVVLIASTGAIVIVGSYSFYNAKRSLMARTFDQLTSVRTIKQRQVEHFFSDRLREMSMFAASQSVQLLAKSLLNEKNNKIPGKNEPAESTSEYQFYLQDYLDDGDYCKSLILALPDGSHMQLFHSDPFDDPGLNTQLLEKLYGEAVQHEGGFIRDIKVSPTTGHQVLIISPVCENGNNLAVLIMEISVTAIDRLMFDASGLQGLGQTGETFLVGLDLIMRTPSRFNETDNLRTIVDTEAVRKAIAGQQGTKVITDYRGVAVLSSFNKLDIPGLEWVICAEIDLEEATIPVYRIRNNIFLVSLGTGILVLVIVALISRMLTRPIVNLMQAADEIGTGKFSTRVMPESTDEVGKLTLAFNRMARQLQQHAEALKKEKSQRIRSVIDGQEIERQRLSRELHDGLGQSLIAIKLRLESLDFDSDPKARQAIEDIRLAFDRIIDEVRRISNNLMPAALHEFGLENALRNHCEELSVQTKMNLQFTSSGIPVELNRKTKTYLYRIAQEALNNVVKHAKASKVRVSLQKDAGSVQLVIEDNGRGIDQEENCKGKGNGLFNMRERVNLLQGTMDVQTSAGNGTIIRIHLPLN